MSKIEPMIRPTMKERQRQLREEAILDVVEELIRTRGISAFTLEDVIEMVGISKPTLYQHFKGKDEMLVAVLARMLLQIYEYVLHMDRSLPVRTRLIEAVNWLFQRRFGEDSFCVEEFSHIMARAKRENSECAVRSDRVMRVYEGLLKEAQEAGVARRDARAELLCASMFSLIKDELFNDRVERGEFSQQELADFVLRMWGVDPVISPTV